MACIRVGFFEDFNGADTLSIDVDQYPNGWFPKLGTSNGMTNVRAALASEPPLQARRAGGGRCTRGVSLQGF